VKAAFEILLETEAARRHLNGLFCREDRSELGQFFTPASIARFMASLFEGEPRRIRILDAGAGAGALFGAAVAEFCSRNKLPDSIEVVAYETDGRLAPHLERTMDLCRQACTESGIHFQGTIIFEDFVFAAAGQIDSGFFRRPGLSFTHAILNPPYKKIRNKTDTRTLLENAGLETSNLYAAFVWLAALLLGPEGELVAITPRSFCNGPYFRRFRAALLDMMSLRRFHLFESRRKPFGDESVLQENVIFHAVRTKPQFGRVCISVSEGPDLETPVVRTVPFTQVVLPGDRDAFIHLVENDEGSWVTERIARFRTTLAELGLEVSTGRVVDFRARGYLRAVPEQQTVPLVYPRHFENGFVRWPNPKIKKPDAIVSSGQTRELLVASGYYVLTKRFTAKEERRRIVAAVYDPTRISASLVGFENHLNYFHAKGQGVPPGLARGLALYLNSTLFDRHFRLFSGHTQVNATDLRKCGYPSRTELLRLGSRIKNRMPDQETIDAILREESGNDG
jgi:adenine-specific DNA-methyltransferase